MTDRITLTGLEVYAHHGVFDTERQNGQRFLIDVVAELELQRAAANDALDQTVHYGLLAEAIVSAAAEHPVDLIETLAERLARVALGFAIDRVTITVHKPGAPITVPFADVSVTITRERG